MSLFDSILDELKKKSGLGDKADSLLMALLSLITSEQTGGLTGFLSRFRQAGLGNLVSAWVSGESAAPLTETQLESALGGNVINGLAQKAGLSSTVTSAALSFLVPKVIDKLTPNGVIPDNSSLISTIGSYLSGFGETLTGGAKNVIGSAAGAVGSTASSVGEGARRMAGAASDFGGSLSEGARSMADTATGGKSALRYILPLLLLVAIGGLGYQYCGRATEQALTPTTASQPTPVVPTMNSKLSLVNQDGVVTVSGVVPDEQTRQSVLAQLRTTFGVDKIKGDLTVDAKARAAEWMNNLAGFLPNFKMPGAELSFDGSAITLGGALADAAKTRLMDALKAAYGTAGFSISSFGDQAAAAVKEAGSKAMEALSSLGSGFSGDELVKALNLAIINFASGSSKLPGDSAEIMKKAAEAIKAAPKSTAIEVGGYTDNQGNAAGNLKLSQARAEAVRAELIRLGVDAKSLMAKGYGGDNPVASNDTEQGRFKNRRIEYRVVNKS
jgi:outer membrane protein OmpA-like peptidoglycan-associated protein/uncharacterized protein YidB (DUF937 family)